MTIVSAHVKNSRRKDLTARNCLHNSFKNTTPARSLEIFNMKHFLLGKPPAYKVELLVTALRYAGIRTRSW